MLRPKLRLPLALMAITLALLTPLRLKASWTDCADTKPNNHGCDVCKLNTAEQKWQKCEEPEVLSECDGPNTTGMDQDCRDHLDFCPGPAIFWDSQAACEMYDEPTGYSEQCAISGYVWAETRGHVGPACN